MTETVTAYRTCPLCEATCGLELTLEDGAISSIRGDADDVFSHGFICPKGFALKALHEDPDRVRTPADPHRLRLRGGLVGRGVRRDRPPPGADPRGARARRRRRLPRQPERPQPRRAALRARVREGARHAQRLLGDHGRPDAEARVRRADVRHRPQHPGPRRRPHRLPADAGRQPARLERQPDDRARHARPPARHPRARRQGRRDRPAPQPHRRARRRAPLHPPGHRRAPAVRDRSTCSSTRASRTSATSPSTSTGSSEVQELAREFTPEAASQACGIDAGRDPPHGARAGRRRARRGLRADRHLHAGVRHARELAGRRAERRDRQPRPAGRRDVHEGRRRLLQHARHARARARACASAAGRRRVRGLPEAFGELPVACLAEEIDTPGDGQVRALFTLAGNPVVSTPNAGRLRRALEDLELMVSVDIYVNETTRHADVILPAPSPLYRSHYDLALYQLAVRNVANYSPRGARARRLADARVADAAAAGRHRRPARARTPTSRPSTTS